MDPLGGVDLRCGCFLVKMYAKMKEFGPTRSTNGYVQVLQMITFEPFNLLTSFLACK